MKPSRRWPPEDEDPPPPPEQLGAVLAGAAGVLLVEGRSDQAAVEVIAVGQGRDLRAEGVVVLPLRGITNLARALRLVAAPAPGARVGGLYDARERSHVRRALRVADPATVGFFECVQDLEDELIRAVGVAGVEQVLAAQEELRSFRSMQQQPAHRGHAPDAQVRRFLAAGSGRKLRYARLLAGTLDLAAAPEPLVRVLEHVAGRLAPARCGARTEGRDA